MRGMPEIYIEAAGRCPFCTSDNFTENEFARHIATMHLAMLNVKELRTMVVYLESTTTQY